MLRKRELRYVAFVDSAREKQGKEYCGHPVLSPEFFYEHYTVEKVKVIVTAAVPSILSDLLKRGYRANNPHALVDEVDFSEWDGLFSATQAERHLTQGLSSYVMYYGIAKRLERPFFQHYGTLIIAMQRLRGVCSLLQQTAR